MGITKNHLEKSKCIATNKEIRSDQQFDFSLIFSQSLILKMNEIVAEKSQEEQIEIKKTIAGEVIGRRLALDAMRLENRSKVITKNANATFDLVNELIQESARSLGDTIEVVCMGNDGKRKIVQVDPNVNIANTTRRQRQRRV